MTTTDQIIKALCNTLVSSLWQGVILAAVAGVIVIATRKSTSAMRYNLLTGALALFAVGSVVTFLTQFKLVDVSAHSTNAANNIGFNAPVNIQTINNNAAPRSENMLTAIGNYLDNYRNTIVCIWFLIICIKSIQFGVGLYGTYTLKRVMTFSPEKFWRERTLQLACLLGVKQAINILESGLAKVPMVVGHLKPVILIPVGMFTALSPNQIEAIIIHELAHIKRRDYLVNLLQSLMEIVFFFNPAVLWISNLIKVERENCCDDIALSQNGNKSNYIHALVSCEEFQSAIPAYAMAFPGNKNSLLNRVKRMANNRNNSLNQYEKALLAICLVMSGLCFSAFAAKDEIKKTVHEVVKVIQHTAVYKANESEKLKAESVKPTQSTVMVNSSQPSLNDDAADTTKKRINVQAVPVVTPVNAAMAITPKVNIQVDPLTINSNPALAPVNTHVNVQVAPTVAYSASTLASINVNPHIGTSLAPIAMLGKLNVNLNVPDTIRNRNNAYNRTFRQIVRELTKMKVITDTSNVSINLNEKELIVNGVKQPDAVYKPIFEKYGKKGAGFGYAYDNNNSRTYNRSYASGSSSGNGYSYSGSNSSGNGNSSSNSNSGSYSYNYSSDSLPPRAARPPRTPRGAAYVDATPRPARPPRAATPDTRAYARAYNDRRDGNEYNQEMLLEDLKKDKIISDDGNVKMSLTSKELIVNGKRQSDEIFQKYKKKYIPADASDSWTWTYSHSND